MYNKNAVVKVAVKHDGYGCESGCCGHVIHGYDKDNIQCWASDFCFEHPYGQEDKVFILDILHNDFSDDELAKIEIDYLESYILDA